MSLIAYYKMNSDFNDSSGNNYHGTPVGATINNVDQKLGAGCGQGDGLNDRVTFSSFFNPSGATGLSIDGWLKAPDPFPNGNYGVFGWWEASQGFGVYCEAGAFDKLYVIFSGTVYGLFNGVDLYTGLTYFSIAFNGNLDGNENRLKIRINEEQKSLAFNGTIPAAITTLTTTPEMFNFPTLSLYWKDLIDDLAIYDHALSESENDKRYNGGAGWEISEAGLYRRGLGRGLNRGLGRGF